jgi:hypothetical protein
MKFFFLIGNNCLAQILHIYIKILSIFKILSVFKYCQYSNIITNVIIRTQKHQVVLTVQREIQFMTCICSPPFKGWLIYGDIITLGMHRIPLYPHRDM